MENENEKTPADPMTSEVVSLSTPFLVSNLVELKLQIGELFELYDKYLEEILRRGDDYKTIAVSKINNKGNQEFWQVRDKFAEKNTQFHATSFRRFDIVKLKKEKPE